MRYRISQIKVNPKDRAGSDLTELLEKAVLKEIRRMAKGRGKAGQKRTDSLRISGLEIIRESIDARKKPQVRLVYTVDFDCAEQLPLEEGKTACYVLPTPCAADRQRPIVVGFGPCGMFAALLLAEAGLKPIVIERGRPVHERVRDVERFWTQISESGTAAPEPDSNVQFGEGGAGTFSDGKLTTGIKDIRIRKVLEEFVEAGADPAILYQHRPHIGTDRLRQIVPNIRRKIEELGGEVRFGMRLEGLVFEEKSADSGQKLCGVRAACEGAPEGSNQDTRVIQTGHVILAIGHSARDTFRMLYDSGFRMEQKPFSIGVRIEHPQEMIDANQYGDPRLAQILGPADYKLSYRCGPEAGEASGRGVYTFCMCPGGQVINASTEAGTSVTNGMSVSRRDSGVANSGLLVDVRTDDFEGDHPLAGIAFQRKYEKLAWENRTAEGLARSSYGQFRRSGVDGAAEDPVRGSLPAFASEAILEAMPVFGRKIKGFDREDARLTAVESRSSSPVRVLRDGNMEAIGFFGVIPAGEGPGYAGGIMSAAVDGIKAAEMIITGGKKEDRSV